jgi:hypothetical protein
LEGSIKRRKRRPDKNNSLFDLNSWYLKTRYYQVRGKEGGRVEVTGNIQGLMFTADAGIQSSNEKGECV